VVVRSVSELFKTVCHFDVVELSLNFQRRAFNPFQRVVVGVEDEFETFGVLGGVVGFGAFVDDGCDAVESFVGGVQLAVDASSFADDLLAGCEEIGPDAADRVLLRGDVAAGVSAEVGLKLVEYAVQTLCQVVLLVENDSTCSLPMSTSC
jgi:hypothetical protein